MAKHGERHERKIMSEPYFPGALGPVGREEHGIHLRYLKCGPRQEMAPTRMVYSESNQLFIGREKQRCLSVGSIDGKRLNLHPCGLGYFNS